MKVEIIVPVSGYRHYTVELDKRDAQEAIEKILSGEGEVTGQTIDEDLDHNNWTVLFSKEDT